jgi:hypothetical protein
MFKCRDRGSALVVQVLALHDERTAHAVAETRRYMQFQRGELEG